MTKTQLFLACDVSNVLDGINLIDKTANYVDAVKIGLEAMTKEDPLGVSFARHFRKHASNRHGKDVFEDWKFHDVANTMGAASSNVADRGSRYFTLHASASDAALEAVAKAVENKAIIPLAVTVLTDLDEPQCQSRFCTSPASAVVSFAKNAFSWGIRGFVCSPLEASLIRDALPDVFIVTPGIRPLWAVAPDEQKRVTTPTQAKRAGANAIVVGRPVSKPPLQHTQTWAARAIREELDQA